MNESKDKNIIKDTNADVKWPPQEMITQLHGSFRVSVISRETNFIAQVALLITGIGGYFSFFLLGNTDAPEILLLVTTVSLFLAVFGYCLCILHGYQYRCDLFQLLKIEYKSELDKWSLRGWPKYNKYYSRKIDPPNIIQAFQKAFVGYAIIVFISSVIMYLTNIDKYISVIPEWLINNLNNLTCCVKYIWIGALAVVFIISAIYCFCVHSFYKEKYGKLIDAEYL